MGRYLSVPVLVLATALSASILPQLVGFGVGLLGNVTPILNNSRGQLSLVMLLVLAWSIRSDLLSGFVWALVGGVLLDLYSATPIGTSSAALMIIVYAANGAAQKLYRMRIVTLLAMTLFATLFFQAYTYFAILLLGLSYDILMVIRLVFIPTIIYNLVGALPIYAIVRLIQRRLRVHAPNSSTNLSLEADAGAA
ncbi:MAG: rod shape-determining protein MreD [Chloroflexi bacterium]|nr:rod shape-determining protein MreD [Chloroflexota bacterium]